MQKKIRGKYAEDVAADRLSWKWFRLRDRNRTIRGGELDLIGYIDDILVVVEVRSVDTIDDLDAYTSATKMSHLLRSIDNWIHKHHRTWPVRLDVIYVRWNNVVERFQNVTNE